MATKEKEQKNSKKTVAHKRAAKSLLSEKKKAARITVGENRRVQRLIKSQKNDKKNDKKISLIGKAPQAARKTPMRGPMAPLASRTKHFDKGAVERRWLIIDAKDQTLGRLATEVATLLKGKHKPQYTPSSDLGDFVVIINAEKVKLSGKKEENKIYFRHTGYIGGLRTKTPTKIRAAQPEQIIEKAVHGMITRNRLGRALMKKLKIYVGENHPHAAQLPVVWNLRNKTNA